MTASIDAKSLYATLGLPTATGVVDVRSEVQRLVVPRYVPTAAHAMDAASLAAWAGAFAPERPIVTYCNDGEWSRQCAELLAARGWQARYLEGGLAAWQSAGFATVKFRNDLDPSNASRWVTRERPKIDRLACPWLVRRFIDPDAQFFYVPAHKVRAQAEALSARPFDIADVTFSHRGARCSFDAFLSEFDLHDPVLDQLADIVRAADTGDLSRAPQAHGLLAISLGLSRNIADDVSLLEQAIPLYDALYAWCKSAREETHSWPQKIQ